MTDTAVAAGLGRQQEASLLRRHRPVLRFDPQYDYRLLAAESAVDNPGNLLKTADDEVVARAGGEPPLAIRTLSEYPADVMPQPGDCLALAPDYPGDARRMERDDAHSGRIYGRVTEDGGRTWLQYWFWLYYNPKNLFGFGKHEGDWEMIQLGLGPDGEPEVATYAQHDSGEARPWGRLERWSEDPRRPVVYVAPLSHASYFQHGTHPYLVGIDHPFKDGPSAVDLPIATFGPWVHWPGKWGSTERTVGGRVGSGPSSPAHQGAKWEHPAAWHRRMRFRRFRVRLGEAIHAAGSFTFPHTPTITLARSEAGRVEVGWRLEGGGLRRGRHLYVTVHEDHFVIAARPVRRAGAEGTTSLLVPAGRTPTAAMVSAYNGLRQRSDPAAAEVRA